jgi:hypothetical protein
MIFNLQKKKLIKTLELRTEKQYHCVERNERYCSISPPRNILLHFLRPFPLAVYYECRLIFISQEIAAYKSNDECEGPS